MGRKRLEFLQQFSERAKMQKMAGSVPEGFANEVYELAKQDQKTKKALKRTFEKSLGSFMATLKEEVIMFLGELEKRIQKDFLGPNEFSVFVQSFSEKKADLNQDLLEKVERLKKVSKKSYNNLSVLGRLSPEATERLFGEFHSSFRGEFDQFLVQTYQQFMLSLSIFEEKTQNTIQNPSSSAVCNIAGISMNPVDPSAWCAVFEDGSIMSFGSQNQLVWEVNPKEMTVKENPNRSIFWSPFGKQLMVINPENNQLSFLEGENGKQLFQERLEFKGIGTIFVAVWISESEVLLGDSKGCVFLYGASKRPGIKSVFRFFNVEISAVTAAFWEKDPLVLVGDTCGRIYCLGRNTSERLHSSQSGDMHPHKLTQSIENLRMEILKEPSSEEHFKCLWSVDRAHHVGWPINDISVGKERKIIVSGGADQLVKAFVLVSIHGMGASALWEKHLDAKIRGLSLVFNDGGVMVGLSNGDVCLLNAISGQIVKKTCLALKPEGELTSFKVSPDETAVIIGDSNGKLVPFSLRGIQSK